MTSDDTSRLHRILSHYRDLEPDRRWEIIQELDRVTSHKPDQIEEHIDTLLELVAWESGGSQEHLASLLEDLFEDHPDFFDEDQLVSLANLATRQNKTLREIALLALKELYGRNPDRLAHEFQPEDLDDWLNGEVEQRERAYRILGATASNDAITTIGNAYKNEIGDARQAAEEALHDIADISVHWLSGTTPSHGAENLEKLAKHAPKITIEYQEALYSGLTHQSNTVIRRCSTTLVRLARSDYSTQLQTGSLVDLLQESTHTAAGRAIGTAIGVQESIPPAVIDHILEEMSRIEDSNSQEKYVVALLEITRLNADRLAPYLDRVLEIGDQVIGPNRVTYIQLLGLLLEVVEEPGLIAPVLLSALESENPDLRKTASQALLEHNFYPVPEQIRASYRDSEADIRSNAWKIQDNSFPPDVEDFISERNSENQLAALEPYLKYYSEPGRWESVEFSEYERRLLQSVSERIQDEMGGHAFFPYDVPEAGFLPVLEIALASRANPSTEKTIGIYTPGTSTQWGTYGDVRELLSDYGFSVWDGVQTAATPLDELVTISRPQNGGSKAWTEHGSNTELIISKSLSELTAVSDLDVLVCNFLGRRPGEFEGETRTHSELFSSVPVISLYGFASQINGEFGWPQYRYPSTLPEQTTPFVDTIAAGDIPDTTASQEDTSTLMTPAEEAAMQFRRLSLKRKIEIERIDTPVVADNLDTLYQIADELDEEPTTELCSTLMGEWYFIRGLPVPVSVYDDWVRKDNSMQGRFAPETTTEKLNMLDRAGERYSQAYVPGSIHDAKQAIEEVYSELEGTNPKYSFIFQEIERAVNNNATIGILFLRKGFQHAFRYALSKETDLPLERANEIGIHLIRPDELRILDDLDTLLLTEPLPQALSRFYLSPIAEELQVPVYSDLFSSFVQNNVEEAIEDVRNQLSIPEELAWPTEPCIEAVDGGEEPDTDVETASDTEQEQSVEEPLWHRLEDLGQPSEYESPSNHNSGRDDLRARVMTADGQELVKDNSESVLLKIDQQGLSDSGYSWVRPVQLKQGDTFVDIPRNLREELYQEALSEHYEEELDGGELIHALQIWWSTLREINDEIGNYDVIYSLLERNGFEKSKAAVRDWIQAVQTADKPIDLPLNPELTIGPDSAADIRLIGSTFDRQKLVEFAEVIEGAMKVFRQENRDLGRELNQLIVMLIEESTTDISSQVKEYTVASIEVFGDTSIE